MKCGECNEEQTLRINTEKYKICNVCFWTLSSGTTNENELKNDVLYFMRENGEWASCRPLVEKCLTEFADTAIADAKVYLLDNVREELKTINEELAQDVAKSRKKSNNRSIAYAQAVDILDILDAFRTKIKVCLNNIKNIPCITP